MNFKSNIFLQNLKQIKSLFDRFSENDKYSYLFLIYLSSILEKSDKRKVRISIINAYKNHGLEGVIVKMQARVELKQLNCLMFAYPRLKSKRTTSAVMINLLFIYIIIITWLNLFFSILFIFHILDESFSKTGHF